jgi:hypothetical protein
LKHVPLQLLQCLLLRQVHSLVSVLMLLLLLLQASSGQTRMLHASVSATGLMARSAAAQRLTL